MLGITFRSYLLFQFHENNSFQPDMSISSLRMTQKADIPILLMPVSHISRIFEKKNGVHEGPPYVYKCLDPSSIPCYNHIPGLLIGGSLRASSLNVLLDIRTYENSMWSVESDNRTVQK